MMKEILKYLSRREINLMEWAYRQGCMDGHYSDDKQGGILDILDDTIDDRGNIAAALVSHNAGKGE